jgi:inner membrane protein
MSSFVGHGLAALTIGKAFETNTNFKRKIFWQSCLVLCAIAPDIDYVIKSLNSVNNDGLRITHSIAFSLILPILLTFISIFLDRKNVFWNGLQACLAGLSHLFLDLMVGGRSGDPLFYPIFNQPIDLPFGILPSAGAISLYNYYFYRNLLIEIGILIPVFIFILFLLKKVKINRLIIVGLLCILVSFLVWSTNLNR